MSSADENRPKEEVIAERQANLPLPDQPPVASDFNSADARTVNVGSGATEGGISVGSGESSGLREPASGDSSVRTDGSAFKTNTAGGDVGRSAGGIPSDAVTGDAKHKAGLKHTENPDSGYPHKNDPSGSMDQTRR